MRHWWTRGLAIFLIASLIGGTLWGLSFRVSVKPEKGLVSIGLGVPAYAAGTITQSGKNYVLTMGNGDQVIIGDTLDNTDFRPAVEMFRWGVEKKTKVAFSATQKGSVSFDGSKITWSSGNPNVPDVRIYYLPIDEQNEFGALEFEVILKKRPSTNTVSLDVSQFGDLVWYYQPPLTAEEIAAGDVRPDNVVGSYAVYHSTKTGNGYRTGKSFHLYRPLLTDALGNTIWASYNTDVQVTGKLIITVAQAWLNSATYPVTIDPTIGYTSKGGSSASVGSEYQATQAYTMSEDGTADSMTVYVKDSGWQINLYAALYNDSGGSPNARVDVSSAWQITAAFDDWHTFALTGAALTNGTIYYLSKFKAYAGDAGSTTYYFYDTSAGYTRYWAGNTDESPAATHPAPSSTVDRRVSMYLTYGTGGVPDITVSPITYDFGVVAESTTPYTATNYFTITNNSTMQTDQTVAVTTGSWSGGVTWTHSDTATPGADTAGLKANKGGTWGTGDVIVKYNTPLNDIATDQPASTNYQFGLKLWAPTSFSDGVQKSITVRVTAVAG